MMREIFARDYRSEEERRAWVRLFEALETRRAVLGTNDWAQSVGSLIKLEYFIDDFTKASEFCGRPVIRSTEAKREVLTLSTVVVGRPLSAREVLRRSVTSHLDYFSFFKHTKLPVKPVQYISDPVDWSFGPDAALTRLRSLLHDEISIETLDRIVAFRRDFNLESMTVFADLQKRQYFEDFVRLASNDVFLDVGAFDGYTTEYLRRRYGNEIMCHLFEPSPRMANILRKKFSADTRLAVHEYALGSTMETATLVDDGSGSHVGAGAIPIQIRPLDAFNLERVDFVKVDIEGSEESFIDGARKTLERCQPQVAIACYHSNSQLCGVFSMMHEVMPDARVFLRHYTEGFAETDLFFIPQRFW